MPDQRSQLEATFLSRLQAKPSPTLAVAPQGERAGRRIDPSLFFLSLDRIRPDDDQVRRTSKSEADASIQELAQSIREVGVLQPIDVRYVRGGDYFEIIAGERRYTAAKLAGLQEVPVKLLDATDGEAHRLQLQENIHREQLSPLELGAALFQLIDEGTTPDELAKLLCKTKSYVTKALSIAKNLSGEAKQAIQEAPERFQSMAHLYEVSLLPAEQQQPVLRKIADEGLTREQLLRLTEDLKRAAQAARPTKGGRPAHAKSFMKTIVLPSATVTVRFPKARVTDEEMRQVLRQAMDALP